MSRRSYHRSASDAISQLLPGIDFNQELEKMDQVEEVNHVALPRNDDDRTGEDISGQLQRLKLNPKENRFFGKSR